MPYSLKLLIDAKFANNFHTKELEDARKTFLVDMFRNPSNIHAQWDETELKFDLTGDNPSVTLSNPKTDHPTKSITIPLTTTFFPRNWLNELLKHFKGTEFSLKVGELKKASKYPELAEIIGNGGDNPFYNALAHMFMKHLMDKKDYDRLILYANQSGFFSYAGLLQSIGIDRDELLVVKSLPGQPMQILRIPNKEDEYLLQFGQECWKQNRSTDKKQKVATVIAKAHYNRKEGKLIANPELIIEIPDFYSQAEAFSLIEWFLANYSLRRKIEILNPKSSDPGPLQLASLNWAPSTRTLTGIISLSSFLLAATIICAALAGVGILPSLPFFAGATLTLGSLSLGASALTALCIAGIGIFYTSLASSISAFVINRKFIKETPDFLVKKLSSSEVSADEASKLSPGNATKSDTDISPSSSETPPDSSAKADLSLSSPTESTATENPGTLTATTSPSLGRGGEE